jgi:hypothetical protein
VALSAGLQLLAAGTAVAAPSQVPCGRAEKGTILVDGLLSDWDGVRAVTFDEARLARGQWSGPADASFSLRCNFDESALYLAIDVRDDTLVRTPAAGRGEDRIELRIGRHRFTIHPGDQKTIQTRIAGGPRGLRVGDGLQQGGWAMEVAVPRAALPGMRLGAPSIAAEVVFIDSDVRGGSDKTRFGSGPIQLSFEGQSALYTNFLNDRGLTPKDVRCDRTVDVGGDTKVERVLVADRFLAVLGGSLGDNYYFTSIPAARGQDVLGCDFLDLTGDRKAEIILRYLERGGGGSREIYAVYLFEEEKLRRIFAQEVKKELGGRRLTSRVSTRPARRGRGREIEVTPGEAVGFTAESYREERAQDVEPILLPWSARKRVVYRWTGDVFASE